MDDRLTALLILCAACAALLIASLALLIRLLVRRAQAQRSQREELTALRRAMDGALSSLRQELSATVQSSVSSLGNLLGASQQRAAEQSELRFKTFEAGNEQKLEAIRETIERRLTRLQADNNEKLDQMRVVVDEKLQQTLESKMTQSFRLVSERLEQVYKGLGEMQSLAAGVGDLKRVLSGVKTRGILGEVQLGAIVEDMLTPDQYEKNVCTRKGSHDPVEYAVRLPGDGEEPVYLPIDAKFPGDTYGRLADAYESGDPAAVREAQAVLADTIRREAKDIRDKYIDPPNTTDFGILFLPTEGLYAEAVRLGLPEKLRREYHVSIAGPTTLAALLNSLQLGFRTLVIQKRSGEVWKLLGAVKKEFGTFEDALTAAQMRIRQTGEELDKLVGVRTRQINRKLKSVELSSAEETAAILPPDAPGDGEDT